MTLTDVRNAIAKRLLKQDILSQADFPSIEIDKDLEPQRDALIRTALKDLTDAGMLRQVTDEHGGLWILTAPLGVAGQEVPISLPTAIHMAREINEFIDAFEQEDWPRCDALNIGEHNILMLMGIIGELRSTDPDDDDEGDPTRN